jgi:hypothetical protein
MIGTFFLLWVINQTCLLRPISLNCAFCGASKPKWSLPLGSAQICEACVTVVNMCKNCVPNLHQLCCAGSTGGAWPRKCGYGCDITKPEYQWKPWRTTSNVARDDLEVSEEQLVDLFQKQDKIIAHHLSSESMPSQKPVDNVYSSSESEDDEPGSHEDEELST